MTARPGRIDREPRVVTVELRSRSVSPSPGNVHLNNVIIMSARVQCGDQIQRADRFTRLIGFPSAPILTNYARSAAEHPRFDHACSSSTKGVKNGPIRQTLVGTTYSVKRRPLTISPVNTRRVFIVTFFYQRAEQRVLFANKTGPILLSSLCVS